MLMVVELKRFNSTLSLSNKAFVEDNILKFSYGANVSSR